jgi:hypothetical protein
MKKILFSLLVLSVIISSCSVDDEWIWPFGTGTTTNNSVTKFIVHDGFMYSLSFNELKTFSLVNPDKPLEINKVKIGERMLESIVAFDSTLFIGNRDQLFGVSIANPEIPKVINETFRLNYDQALNMFEGCDPVVIKNKRAFVTTKFGNTSCGRFTPENKVFLYDISVSSPVLLDSLTLAIPEGLAYLDNRLYVCDFGDNQVKVFDISTDSTLVALTTQNIDCPEPKEALIMGQQLVISAKDEYRIYDISNPDLAVKVATVNK